MNHWIRKLLFAASLWMGLATGAHAVYAESNPLMYTDSDGLNPVQARRARRMADPHWDVQYPGGDEYNIYPGGKRRDR